jgi:tetratricopeptide (TPR) repeat protein
MAKEKKQRYRAVDEMRHDIERWLAGDGVSVFNDPLPVRIMRKARKRPTLFVTFGLTVLLGTMAIGLDRLRAHYAAAELLAANEDLNARLEELASSQQKLGAELYQRGEKLRALNEIANAVRAAERKFRNEPSLDNEVKYLQAAAGLSLLQHKTDQKELALITSEGVYSRLHELIGQNPENVGLLRLKVLLLGNRGMTDLALRQPGESPTVAVATYKEALEVLRQIQMLEPVEERDATQREFARINGNLADALAETHDHEQELVHRRTAIAILKEMVAKGDSAGPFLGVHVVRLASQLFELNRTEEAIAELRAATDVFPYIEAGEPENWGQQLNAAKCLVRMADTETETTISDKYRHRAMEVLVSMQNRGFFVKHPQLAEVIETDPLLSSLRDRPDYMQLLSRVHADFRK